MTTFHQYFTVATKGVGTRNRPSSPLQLGVSDPDKILKTASMIRRSHSSPVLCNLDQLDISSPFSILKGEEQESSWLKPTIPITTFQVLNDPQSFKKVKTISHGRIPLFHLKVGKTPFQPSSSQIFKSSKPINLKMAAQNQALDMMDQMVAARYAPLVLPQPLNALFGGDYQKYLCRFNGQGETTTKER